MVVVVLSHFVCGCPSSVQTVCGVRLRSVLVMEGGLVQALAALLVLEGDQARHQAALVVIGGGLAAARARARRLVREVEDGERV